MTYISWANDFALNFEHWSASLASTFCPHYTYTPDSYAYVPSISLLKCLWKV